MKSTFFYLFAVLLVSAALITSCTEDPITGGAIGPGTSSSTTASEIIAQGSFDINVTGTAGDNPMNSLAVQKDGVNIPLSAITINSTAAAANPILLFGDDKNSFNYDMTIQTDLAAGEASNYTFIITDEIGETSTESAFISVSDVMTPPTLTRDGSQNALSIVPGQQFTHKLTGIAGSSDLATLEIQEDGVAVDASRVDVSGQTMISNPIAIGSGEAQGFTDWMVDVRAADTEKTSTYLYILTDAQGQMDTVTRVVTTVIPGSPLDSIKTQLNLFNSAGPAGTGGVNLITGASVGSGDAGAHLRDIGINNDLPSDVNWRQQIGAGNATTTLKEITSAAQPEGFSYSSVDTKEAIIAAFNAETNIVETASTSVNAGSMFVLLTSTGTYMLVNIDAVVPNPADNTDYYEISAKY